MHLIPDSRLVVYLFHRYRYEIFPQRKTLDNAPPYVQIEPSSICNYRCKFCFQTDKSFSDSHSKYMGTMSFETYKIIVDMLEGKTEFLSLASEASLLYVKICQKCLIILQTNF